MELTGLTVEVDTLGLFVKTIKVVILPIVAGVLLNRYFNFLVKRVRSLHTFFSCALHRLYCGFYSCRKKGRNS